MDEASLQRKLKKALVVASKLKKRELLEQEVSKELARRNEALKQQNMAMENRFGDLSQKLRRLQEEMSEILEKEAGTLEASSTLCQVHIPTTMYYIHYILRMSMDAFPTYDYISNASNTLCC
ncbi:hypothetical protein EON65_58065 [archaeon]|nr:MAG: hypothetical protein EON65_58065 [archaeon]